MKAHDILNRLEGYEEDSYKMNLIYLADQFLIYRTKEIKIYKHSSLGNFFKKHKKEIEDLGYKFLKTPNWFRNYYIVSVE